MTVFVVDDQQDFIDLARLLLTSPLTIIGTASTAAEALSRIPELGPELVVVDVMMPGLDGFQLTRQLLKRRPELKVVLMSDMEEAEFSYLAEQAGALGFLPKKRLSPSALRSLLVKDE